MAVYIYQPYVHTQNTSASVWGITHGFNRDVTVTVFDEEGKQVGAKVEKVSDNEIRISFFEKGVAKAIKGRAVIG